MKKIIIFVLSILMFVGCETPAPDPVDTPVLPPGGDSSGTDWNAANIASWDAMKTPLNDAKGSAVLTGDYVVITAKDDNWGGLQSPEFDLEYGKKPACLVDIQGLSEQWGIRFVPSVTANGDNGWGFALVGDEDDNVFGEYIYINMGKIDISQANEGKKFTQLYPAETVKGRMWIYAVGYPGSTVNIKSIKVFYPEE